MMAHTPSQLGVTLTVAFKEWDYAWGRQFYGRRLLGSMKVSAATRDTAYFCLLISVKTSY